MTTTPAATALKNLYTHSVRLNPGLYSASAITLDGAHALTGRDPYWLDRALRSALDEYYTLTDYEQGKAVETAILMICDTAQKIAAEEPDFIISDLVAETEREVRSHM